MNSNNTYKPQPLDISDVVLSEELKNLTELLAKNVHDIWAENRIAQGWTYGEKRDDEKKQHPCLVPYEDLPEEEKLYDRETAMKTIKMIKKLGFQIIEQ
ncbi:MAG: RyR domain-containing protein [Synergistales bacterium]|nr:RyR domain-containing protein [Bacteroidales bacterium]MDY6394725.1 RyR domain-containing protein [Bacteroidales bacterium]MDY6403304.1 RyR domain-containing protein [Bacteroidales bacterium]MDY6424598.1 RyR domain-containing protein [Bacteroidales bacterium]MDY6435734.1 RyR domain-containing protein [Synergistales bacterium]